jgi:hypothetical protein
MQHWGSRSWCAQQTTAPPTCQAPYRRPPPRCPFDQVRVLLSRLSHGAPGFKLRGSAVRAFTPSNPEPQDEAWYVFLTDPANNHVVAWTKVGPPRCGGLSAGPRGGLRRLPPAA